jgi:hypothetical protein
MRKPRTESKINQLPANHRAELELWLFEERISYKEACARLLTNFGLKIAQSSLCEWYQRASQTRLLESIVSKSGASQREGLQNEAAKLCFERFALVKLVMDHQAATPAETIGNIEFVLFRAPQEMVKQAASNFCRDFSAAKSGGADGHFRVS